LTIIEEIQDEISGTVLQRPGLDRLRKLVRAGSVDAVVVYTADRLSRDSIDLKILKGSRKDSPAGIRHRHLRALCQRRSLLRHLR
jgi:DNA invertase Pin-like site-specific DNA recombinase